MSNNKDAQLAYIELFRKRQEEYDLDIKIAEIARQVVKEYFEEHKEELK